MSAITSSIINTPNFSTNLFVEKDASKDFAKNIQNKFEELSTIYDVGKVKNIVILYDADAEAIKNLTGIDETDKELLMDYISDDAKDAYGFYSKKAQSFVFIEKNHGRKDKSLEGTISEQGADTLAHEFGHLFGNENSKSSTFRAAYLTDLKAINEKLVQNPNAKIGDSDMTYKEAIEYFDHYLEGVDFSDGISEDDVSITGAKENYAEAFSILNDSFNNESNNIFAELFSNTLEQVRKDCSTN